MTRDPQREVLFVVVSGRLVSVETRLKDADKHLDELQTENTGQKHLDWCKHVLLIISSDVTEWELDLILCPTSRVTEHVSLMFGCVLSNVVSALSSRLSVDERHLDELQKQTTGEKHEADAAAVC